MTATHDSAQALVPTTGEPSIELARAAWLDAKAQRGEQHERAEQGHRKHEPRAGAGRRGQGPSGPVRPMLVRRPAAAQAANASRRAVPAG